MIYSPAQGHIDLFDVRTLLMAWPLQYKTDVFLLTDEDRIGLKSANEAAHEPSSASSPAQQTAE